ncbi:formyltetrahydrofolate deformylase [Candidatus Erwinia haradaeae]|uniref:Formyltetrahydrofolate deformylase n=1 Tax=Candidatus Erwinia haradaeae TaxID=1922217 RepID=A0A451DIE7_9GAMM|nr:formyltetrahydrofolate deformylase [Candidatus Erwinia haradaeae]VFP86450.1 Formyltetrahydrofolate deformylase [Candidatus Erwinia haradaeae]
MQDSIQQKKILKIVCPDAAGLIAKITAICYQYKFNILKNNEFIDDKTSCFFMRSELAGCFYYQDNFLKDLNILLPVGSRYSLKDTERRKIVILVSHEVHCLGELLIKSAYGELDVEISAVISNHKRLSQLVHGFNVPFIFFKHEGLTCLEQENNIIGSIDLYQPDYIVLAKYMRILTPDFLRRYPNKIINIHHSLLPAFVGSRPYHQAYARGVKIIGATAHYVTNQLDAGPIIMQDAIHIDHTYSAEDMMRAGHDVEKNVLSRALNQILTHRVFLNGNRTILL